MNENSRGQVVLNRGWNDPDVHLRRRGWLEAGYIPGPCVLCGRECDLREAGTVILFAFGAPVEIHAECGNRNELWGGNLTRRDDILMSHAVAYFAWPGARRYEVPAGGY